MLDEEISVFLYKWNGLWKIKLETYLNIYVFLDEKKSNLFSNSENVCLSMAVSVIYFT